MGPGGGTYAAPPSPLLKFRRRFENCRHGLNPTPSSCREYLFTGTVGPVSIVPTPNTYYMFKVSLAAGHASICGAPVQRQAGRPPHQFSARLARPPHQFSAKLARHPHQTQAPGLVSPASVHALLTLARPCHCKCPCREVQRAHCSQCAACAALEHPLPSVLGGRCASWHVRSLDPAG